MRVVLAILYALVGIPQVFAISSGLMARFSLSLLDAGMLGLVIGYLPFVGTVTAIGAARVAWGLPWPLGILIFFWTIPLSLALWSPMLEKGRMPRRLPVSSGHRGASKYSMALPDPDTGKAREAEESARQHGPTANPTRNALSLDNEHGRSAGAVLRNSPAQGALSEPEGEQLGASGQGAIASDRPFKEATHDWLHTLAGGFAARLEKLEEDPVEDPGRDEDRAGIKELVDAAKDHPYEAFDLAVRYLLSGSKGGGLMVAFHLFQGAAQTGLRSAQFNLAVMYEHGEGVGRSLDSALECYRQAAGREHVRAMFRLADAHKQGELGVPVDPQREGEWLAKVVDATLEDAKARRA